MTRVALAEVFRVKLPSRSVIVPFVALPFSTTDAPMMGSPVASFTLPVIETVCAETLSDKAANNISSRARMFFTWLDILCMFTFSLLI